MNDNIDESQLAEVLKGKTLKIYYHMLSSGRSWSARELRRYLNLSSPSLSLYHLNKLQDTNLVEIDEDGLYKVCKVVRVGVLRRFLKVRGQLVPRFLFYGVFFFSVLVLSIVLLGISLHPIDLTFIIMMTCGCLIFLYETAWIYRHGFD